MYSNGLRHSRLHYQFPVLEVRLAVQSYTSITLACCFIYARSFATVSPTPDYGRYELVPLNLISSETPSTLRWALNSSSVNGPRRFWAGASMIQN